jgi:NCS1 family nucleobase:cation symporter-1
VTTSESRLGRSGESPAEATGEPRVQAFEVEQIGIDIVPADARHGRPRDLFWMWLGTNLNVFYPVNGALLIYFGMSFAQAIAVILVGNLAFIALGLTSLQGPKTGTTNFAISRAAFGPVGGRRLSIFNWITCVGFEASGMALIVLAGQALVRSAGGHPTTLVTLGILVLAALIQVFLPIFGHQTIVIAQKYLALLLVPLFVAIAVIISGKVHLSGISHTGNWTVITLGLALVISGGGLSWANAGSDYSRYLPENVNMRALFAWTTLGGMLPAVLLEILGAAVASVVTNASDPISGLPAALPGWVSTPYLIMAIITLLAVNTIDLYSSGLTLQAMGVPVKRWHCVIIDMAIATVVAGITIFDNGFNRIYSDFLSLLIVWLTPWCAIYVVDWALRRGRYDAKALLEGRTGRYWRGNGIHWPGVIAQLAGMAAACLWINSPAFVGPLSQLTSKADFSFWFALLVAGVVYYALARRTVPAEAPSVGEDEDELDRAMAVL